MRSITFVQAFQYWLKLTALLVPAFFLLAAWAGDGAPRATFDAPAVFREHTSVTLAEDVRLSLDEPLTVTVTGQVDGHGYVAVPLTLAPGGHSVRAHARLEFAPDTPVPDTRAEAGLGVSGWSEPLSGDRPEHRLYATYGLILATFLGTMGLPHVAVRFYTSPNGRAARRTTLVVLGLVGAFYLLPPVYGALGRIYAPELALTGDADAAVLVLPERMLGGLLGELLGALLAGGAFAAFLSTASGLTMAVAGVLHQDVLAGARGAQLPFGGARGDPGAAGRERDGDGGAGGGRGGPGLRRVGVVVLSSAGAGHLVARADPARGGGGSGHRRRRGAERGTGDADGAGPGGLGAHAAGVACGVVGAARVPDDGRGVAGHPVAGPGRGGGHPGPAAPAGERGRGPGVGVPRRSEGEGVR